MPGDSFSLPEPKAEFPAGTPVEVELLTPKTVHMAPGKLFDQAAAERFEAEGRMILRPGEKIAWQ